MSWSHYCYLVYIEDVKRRFYEKECVNSKWSKRQINSSLFQRLLFSLGNINKKKVYELSKNGKQILELIDSDNYQITKTKDSDGVDIWVVTNK